MTEAQYLALTAACDDLLRTPPVTHEKVAVPWLHVRSEHPNNLTQYQCVFERPGLLPELSSSLRHSAGIARTLARSLWSSTRDAQPVSAPFPPKVDVLFVSHLVSAQTQPESRDFYYGDLPEELASRGLSSLVVMHNALRSEDPGLTTRLTRGGVTSRLVLPRWSTFRNECRLTRRARVVARDLLVDARAAQHPLNRIVALEAARHAATGSTIAALRFHAQLKQLCARFRPRAIFVTWEGHAWERLAFYAARSVDPSVRCVGYQHTVLFPRAHALKRPLGGWYDPDLILTLGDVTRDILSASEGLSGTAIMTYGSHRHPSATKPRAADAAMRCLVIPEGLEPECLTLFDFALAAAARLPDLQFVLRTHPVLPFDSLARRYPRFRSLPANVCASSQADITADFAQCDWALYRGSSAAVHAVLAGVRPMYVELQGEMSIDPLCALNGWRRHVSSEEVFDAVIAADRAAAPEDRLREWEPARAFCARYVLPPKPDMVHGLLTH